MSMQPTCRAFPWLAISLVLFVVNGGCGGGGPATPPLDAAAVETGTPAKDAGAAAAYPPGPYGIGPGAVVEDATFLGYRRFDERTLVPMAFHDYFNPDGTKMTAAGVPATTLLVTAGAVWCNPCVQEAKALPVVADKFLAAGMQVVQDLYQGPSQATMDPAMQEDLDRWVMSYALTFPVFIDPGQKLAPYFDVAALPFVMLVDTRTMKILGEKVGFTGQASLEAFLCAYLPTTSAVCP